VATGNRQRILERARPLLGRGETPTVGELAAAAGVSRASFYRAFGSREALLEALDLQPEPGSPERILEAALTLVGEHGLTELSMDELAARAEVSRATLYRLFPGKGALFTSLLRRYSPLEPVGRLIVAKGAEPPGILMPEVARTVHHSVYGAGENRMGMLRTLFFEVGSLAPDTADAAQEAIRTIVGTLVAYLVTQMEAGRLRRMHPLLALQAFVGPIFFHLMTRPLAERALGLEIDGEAAVTELAEAWLRAMAPTGGVANE
jgi:AcrR family transcriptional regulator